MKKWEVADLDCVDSEILGFWVLIWTTSPHATFTGYKISHWTWMHTLPDVQNFWLETRQASLSYKHPPPSSHNFHLIGALVRLSSQSGTDYLGSHKYMLINLSIIHILYTFLGMSEWALWKSFLGEKLLFCCKVLQCLGTKSETCLGDTEVQIWKHYCILMCLLW